MKVLRAYVDTSVLGGCFDRDFEADTAAFIECVQKHNISALFSDIVVGEVSRAPRQVQDLLRTLIEGGAEVLPVSEETLALQESYLKSNVLTRKWMEDALHVAIATVARADVLVSWNFKHLVDPRRVRAFNGVNLSMGYGLISILPPGDIVHLLKDLS